MPPALTYYGIIARSALRSARASAKLEHMSAAAMRRVSLSQSPRAYALCA